MLHDGLWKSNSDVVESCLAHPFVQALGQGTLKASDFRNYVAQDAYFLEAFAKAYRLARARGSDPDFVACFSDLLAGVQNELKLHRVYAVELGIDLARVAPNPACRAYTEFLIHIAEHGSLAETVAALAPCMSLYAILGRVLAPKRSPGNPYSRWIDTYGSWEFAQLAHKLEAVLDRVGADCKEVRAAYRHALECELAFFSASLEQ